MKTSTITRKAERIEICKSHLKNSKNLVWTNWERKKSKMRLRRPFTLWTPETIWGYSASWNRLRAYPWLNSSIREGTLSCIRHAWIIKRSLLWNFSKRLKKLFLNNKSSNGSTIARRKMGSSLCISLHSGATSRWSRCWSDMVQTLMRAIISVSMWCMLRLKVTSQYLCTISKLREST